MNFEVNIRLSFSSDLLTSLEIAVSNAKGIVCQFDLQHPLVYLFNQFNNNNLSYKAAPGLLTYEKQKCYDEFEQQEKVLVPQIESAPTEVIRLLNTSNQAAFEELLESVKQGLLVHDPELVEEGVNGTYFLKNQDGEIVCVFKPKNEEGSSEFNPKNSNDAEIASHLAHGIQPGEAAEREVAAYLLDKTGFFGVPKTTMVEINHKETSKIGSIQQFVENDGASWDIGPGLFPVQEIQKIGLLDLYMLNTDRHGGNILFQENSNRQITLHPIDNGFSLPETIGIDNLWFEWMNWSQSKLPFTEKSKKFLEELNVDEDVAMLREQTTIRSECLSTLKIMGNFVKYSVLNHNKTLYDLGKLVCSNGSDGSELKLLCDRVTGICGPLTNDNNDAWFQQFNSELDALFAQ